MLQEMPFYSPPGAALVPLRTPDFQFIYEAIVDCEVPVELGISPLGRRLISKIKGGTFEGPALRGRILPGGADRQLYRNDGARSLEAIYEMKTQDGIILSVHNSVVVLDEAPDQARYAFSHVKIIAPQGNYDWLNRCMIVGTLDSLFPDREAVVIRAFKVVFPI